MDRMSGATMFLYAEGTPRETDSFLSQLALPSIVPFVHTKQLRAAGPTDEVSKSNNDVTLKLESETITQTNTYTAGI